MDAPLTNGRKIMKKYNIGIDLTYGTHLEVEAKSVEEATEIAKQMIETNDNGKGPMGFHFVGIKTHSEYEK